MRLIIDIEVESEVFFGELLIYQGMLHYRKVIKGYKEGQRSKYKNYELIKIDSAFNPEALGSNLNRVI